MSELRPGSVTPTGGQPSYPPRSASTGAARSSTHRPLSSNSNSGSSFVNSPTSPAAVGNTNGSSPTTTAAAQAQARRTSAASSAAPTTPGAGQINRVTYKNATIKALIDPSLPVADVIRQLCANAHLGVQEPPALFALRDEEDEELVDDANMARKISAGRNFRLCSSPTIEAVEMVDKLSTRDERVLKMATYTLQRLIREAPFSTEFIRRGGLDELVGIVLALDSGNTLAYALTCVQNLMESTEEGWETLQGNFIAKVVHILATQERINVCRPATAILKKLVLSGPDAAPGEQGRVIGEAETAAVGGVNGAAGAGAKTQKAPSAYRFGFEVVYAEIEKEPSFLSTLMQRLSSADTTLCLYSLSLINSLMRHVSSNLFEVFTAELERLSVSKAVARLMDSTRGEELSSSILEYQNNVIRVAHRRMRTTVTPTNARHVQALSYIWLQARITETVVGDGEEENSLTLPPTPGTAGARYKWRRLGFEGENVAKEFSRTGWLGLECCEAFVRADPDAYAKIILEQINRPSSRRCPWGLASLEVVEILSDHYDIDSGYSTSTMFMPFILFFVKVHALALRFFLRMWSESGAARSDFGRVSALVRSQVKEALRDEASKTWFDVERDFVESEYRNVRDRQMRELETEDDFTSKASIRNLRGRLYRESYEFVRQQRIQCLLEGAWFRNPTSATRFNEAPSSGRVSRAGTLAAQQAQQSGQQQHKPWRFYRLSPNKKYLHYCEANERTTIRSGLDDLPERIDMGLVADVSLHSAAQGAGVDASNAAGAVAQRSATAATNGASDASLTFSLLRAPDVSLADLVALDAAQFSEWTDGLGMLRGEGGVVSTKETADYIQILTDIGVKVKLLDLTGERIEVPASLPLAPLPISTSFFFADL